MRPVAAGLQAALLLAWGRAEGLILVGAPAGALVAARRSFWAMAFCLPALLCLELLGQRGTEAPASPGRDLALRFLGFAIGWLLFALASHRVAVLTGRTALWPRYITLYNWCNVVQYLMLVVALVPGLLGLPDIIGTTAWLVALGWALWLEWFMTGLALAVPGAMAAALVALDVFIGLLVAGIAS